MEGESRVTSGQEEHVAVVDRETGRKVCSSVYFLLFYLTLSVLKVGLFSFRFGEDTPMIMTCFTFQLVGKVAPTISNLVDWLQQNSSYDVAEESTAFVRSKVGYCRFRKTGNNIWGSVTVLWPRTK